MPVKYRTCTGPCARSLPLTEFWSDANAIDGRMSRCKTCTMERRKELATRRANGEVIPTITDEERKRRSEHAKRLNAEGRFGGAEIGRLGAQALHSRPRRVAEVIADFARSNPDLIEKALQNNLRAKNKSQQMRAVEFLAKHELEAERVAQTARGSGKTPDEMTQDELRAFVEQGIRAQIERGEIDFSQIIEGTAQEVA